MLEPNFKVTSKEIDARNADITIEPLPVNFGHTLGNSLRRTLLTSLEGGAAIRVQIDGVPHQFSTVSGMKEDVLDFILNLKTVDFGVDSDEPVEIKLRESGERVIKAGDLDLPSGVTVTNPDVVLATLTSSKSKLNAVITVARGRGFVSAEENATDEIGVIPLDASFSPVVKCHYTVEAARVGRSSNFDKIRMSLTTDGTISPVDALKEAAKLVTSFTGYVNSDEAYIAEPKAKKSKETAGYIDDLDLPTRILNSLKKAGINKLADLEAMSLSDLQKVKNLGEKSASSVVDAAAEKGITIA